MTDRVKRIASPTPGQVADELAQQGITFPVMRTQIANQIMNALEVVVQREPMSAKRHIHTIVGQAIGHHNAHHGKTMADPNQIARSISNSWRLRTDLG